MKQELLQQMELYMNGVREGNADMMKPAFLPEATMYGFDAEGTLAANGSIDVSK